MGKEGKAPRTHFIKCLRTGPDGEKKNKLCSLNRDYCDKAKVNVFVVDIP